MPSRFWVLMKRLMPIYEEEEEDRSLSLVLSHSLPLSLSACLFVCPSYVIFEPQELQKKKKKL